MNPKKYTELDWSNIHPQTCVKDENRDQINQLDLYPITDLIKGEKSKLNIHDPLTTKSDDYPPNSSTNREKSKPNLYDPQTIKPNDHPPGNPMSEEKLNIRIYNPPTNQNIKV